MNGMQELRDLADGMCRLEAALTVMAPARATKYDMENFTTAMETRFDAMSKCSDAIEERVQSLQDGWKVVPDEDGASRTGGPTNEWDGDGNPHHWCGWQGCGRCRLSGSDGARGSR